MRPQQRLAARGAAALEIDGPSILTPSAKAADDSNMVKVESHIVFI